MEKNTNFLSEELKRHKRLVEYTFYVDEDDDLPVAQDDKDPNKKLILQADPETDDPANPADMGGEAGAGEENPDAASGGEAPVDLQVSDNPQGDAGAQGGAQGGIDVAPGAAQDAPVPPAPEEQPTDEVDIDVTELVNGTEEAKQMAQLNGQKMEELLTKFNELTSNLGAMDMISKKIEDLEHEVQKRNPTPDEKLEMRSLDSYPYNLKLTDFWAEKEGNYDVMGNEQKQKEKEKEYVLTQDDVNADFNQGAIKKSFDEYEEEDIT